MCVCVCVCVCGGSKKLRGKKDSYYEVIFTDTFLTNRLQAL